MRVQREETPSRFEIVLRGGGGVATHVDVGPDVDAGGMTGA